MTEKKFVDRLNKRIIIQSKTRTSDGLGGYSETWSDLKTLWAEIKPISNTSNFETSQIEEKIIYTITIRYYSPLTTQCRIKYGNRVFNIVCIKNPLENNQTMEITSEEIL